MPHQIENPTQRRWLKDMLREVAEGIAPPIGGVEVIEFLFGDYPFIGEKSIVGIALLNEEEFDLVRNVLDAIERMYDEHVDFGEALVNDTYIQKKGWAMVRLAAGDAHRQMQDNDERLRLEPEE